MKKIFGVLLVLVLVFSLGALGLPSPVLALTFTVNSTGDATDAIPGDGVAETAPDNGETTLRAAIQETNALAGPDTINLPAGTYTLTIAGAGEDASATGDLDINDDLTITGADRATTIIDGGSLDRVLHIDSGKTVEITGVTVQNGEPWLGNGGGIDNNGGTLTLTNSTVTSNTASTGGGIFSISGIVTLSNSTVGNNNATNDAGGIYNRDSTLTLTNSTISNNIARRSGGGIFNMDGTVTLTNSTVSGNSAGHDGGGILSDGSGSTVMITDSIITGNTAGRLGGGIINKRGPLTLTGSTVSNNTASSDGGGIRMTGTVQITNSVINGNNAGGAGAGIFNWGPATLTNVTISGNSATSNGGGLGNWSTITLTNVTINANSADGTGGGVYVASGTVNLKNTIVANSVSGGDFGGAGVTSLGYNLDSDGTGALGATGDLSSTNPLLGPLADNGGPTFTHALLPGSPAIDAGDNTGSPTTDQRGVARPIDGDGDSTATCDIGAYEYVPPPPVADFSGAPTAGDVPLTVGFTDESTGLITSWLWDFGDGDDSTDQSPSHTYTAPDTYTVSLTVTGPGGTDTETKDDYIIVSEPGPPPSWTHIFEDPKRGTELFINTNDKTFQFTAPSGYDSGVVEARYMRVRDTHRRQFISIWHRDNEMRFHAFAMDSNKDLCVALMRDRNTWKRYRLFDPRGIE